ncbi:uncharacterized protein NEMAJ01_2069 [Nematocida major]|uniref:uncharacterized protein n=1 Tax=Nematocida major TaxID=1912982 RepID=UPI002007CE96|nr:uncharacterized protein NEMAJ01_2069 [Nematocida major]KAH9387173.1 hypothetical protein NEMAJ01_2069 [Nematocida major]
MDYSAVNLERIIGSLKKQVTQQDQDKLLPYTETEDRRTIIFQRMQEEDSMGKFYCLILLQKSLNKPRTEQELDNFLESVQYILESVHFSTHLEISKAASLYSSAALFYWPIKMPQFVNTLSALIHNRNPLGVLALKNFLQLVSDSLEITEERRYELKKAISKIEGNLLTLLYQCGSRIDVLEVLLLMNRLDIVNDRITVLLLETLEGEDPATNEALSRFIRNITINANPSLFHGILSALCTKSPPLAAAFVGNNVNILEGSGRESAPLAYKAVSQCIFFLEEMDSAEIEAFLKVYLKLIRSFCKQKSCDLSGILAVPYPEFVVRLAKALDSEGEENRAVTEGVLGVVGAVGALAKEQNTEMFRECHWNMPSSLAEVVIRNLICPVYTGNPFLDLKQAVVFKDAGEALHSLEKAQMKTQKECNAVREAVEMMHEMGTVSDQKILALYERALAANNFYSIDLAVSLGLLMQRDSLVLGAVNNFAGKGVVAFISMIEKCPHLAFGLFDEFIRHLLAREEIINEIEALSKLLERESALKKARVDAVQLFGREVLEKVFSRIDAGSVVELRKVAKILPFLQEKVHEAFLQKMWIRAKGELERQMLENDHAHGSAVQSIVGSIAAECKSPVEGQVLYDLVEFGEYPVRSVLQGVKGVIAGSKASEYARDVLRAMVSVLVSAYATNSDENTRAAIVGLLIEDPERVDALQEAYGIDLGEVRAAKEKRPPMKRALRRVEGMSEKHGALLKKAKTESQEEDPDRWSKIATPFM